MNKNIRNALVFAVILVATLYAVQYAVDALYKRRATDKYAKLLNHQLDPEIMIFGSSNAIKHFSPAIIKNVTGSSAYNMGYDGMFFMQYYPLMQEHLKYEKNCKMVVIACNPYLGKDWIVMVPHFFYAWLNNPDIYRSFHEIDPARMFKARYIPGYKLTLLAKPFYWGMVYRKPEDTANGYEPVLEHGNEFNDFIKPFREPIDPYVYSLHKSIVSAISAKGIKVVLVMSPILDKGRELILNADSVIATYRSLEDTAKNIYFLDYSKDSLSTDKKYFRNYTHLNKRGAEIFSTTLSADLLRIKNK
ncbi:MAG: hypothetical protein V4649_06785 [Bacteroidota bacterium]